MSNGQNPEGTVLEIMRMSTEDGPGLRTTVFLKGCPLRCTWCHNPESISPKPQLHWVGSRCIGCKLCLTVCPRGALSAGPDGIVIDRAICTGCGTCANECPSTALELMGWSWRADDLAAELAKDKAFFDKSGGGVTLSGGEATMQAPFAEALLQLLRAADIQTALDTCGQTSRRTLDSLLPHADLVLYDLKEIDPRKHKAFTGADNRTILENLIHIVKTWRVPDARRRLWVRTPIIPGATDRADNIRGIGEFLAKIPDGLVERWELCSFNNLCRDKYTRLGLTWQFADSPLMNRETMEQLAAIARDTGVDPQIVHWSGATRLPEETRSGATGAKLRTVKCC